MSYGVAAALQTAIFAALDGAAAITVPVFDAPGVGALPETYVLLGTEEARARGDSAGSVTEHRVTVAVVTSGAGFAEAKIQAGAVSDVLDGADLPLTRGHLIGLRFDRARARRDGPAGRNRRIDLRFVARVEDNS